MTRGPTKPLVRFRKGNTEFAFTQRREDTMAGDVPLGCIKVSMVRSLEREEAKSNFRLGRVNIWDP